MSIPQRKNKNPHCSPFPYFKRPFFLIFLTLFFLLNAFDVSAGTVADKNAGQNRPQIEQTANGRELVQIATPNGAGLSHNKYTTFNVDPSGLIFNNSRTNVNTQLGGWIAGNSFLANGPARSILNEVTSSNRSYLNGYMEVAGQRADVIVANPNGITCSGCGFINAARGVLTTGTPLFGSSGSLDGFRVTGGNITIGSGGFLDRSADQVDLLARSIAVNGEIWANRLNIIAGANLVNYANLGVQVIQGDDGKPTVAIDSAQLGGMYANKIMLIGTEKGVGVNLSGVNAALDGGFPLDADVPQCLPCIELPQLYVMRANTGETDPAMDLHYYFAMLQEENADA